jgi:Arc/MetJ family transcription regulator
MRTNIFIDDKLINEALSMVAVKTKKDIVNLALKEFVEHHKRKNLLDLKSKISFQSDYDYKKLRNL